jgi:hypothetical protein
VPSSKSTCIDCQAVIWARSKRCRACDNSIRRGPSFGDHFWAKVDRRGHDECWPWLASRDSHNYGHISRPGNRNNLILAHRAAWELTHGQIPSELQVLHRCDNRPCCNPHHLFLGTNADNVADKVAKGRGVKGSLHPKSKLSENDVQMIRATYADGAVTHRALARFFGVNSSTITNVLARKHWRHVGPSPC